MYLPSCVQYAIEKLEHQGFEAYAVGGCVRDAILGKAPFDYDVTTSATPEEMQAVFANEHTVETGIKHGTVTVLVEHEPIEITTFRVDLGYEDNRHPIGVRFTKSIEEDLSRRDFTVNAMAYGEKRGLIDPFGGKADLEHKIIRAVGNADARFNEDALRIMRGLRFAATLGFLVEEETAKAIHKNKDLLKNISAERLSTELSKLLCGKNAAAVLEEYFDVICVLMPELAVLKGYDQHHYRHNLDLLGHTLAAISAAPAKPVLRLAALFHDIGKPDCRTFDETGTAHYYGHAQISAEIAEQISDRLKFDNETKETVTELILHHEERFTAEPKQIKRMLNKLGEERFALLLYLMEADEAGKAEEYRFPKAAFDDIRAAAEKILEEKECFSLKDLAVNGGDLIAAGFAPGPEMGKTLNKLLEAVMDGKAENEKEELIKYLNIL